LAILLSRSLLRLYSSLYFRKIGSRLEGAETGKGVGVGVGIGVGVGVGVGEGVEVGSIVGVGIIAYFLSGRGLTTGVKL